MNLNSIPEELKEAYRPGSGPQGPTFTFCVTVRNLLDQNEEFLDYHNNFFNCQIENIYRLIEKFQEQTPKYKDNTTGDFIKTTCETIIRTNHERSNFKKFFGISNNVQDLYIFDNINTPFPSRGFFQITLLINHLTSNFFGKSPEERALELGRHIQHMLNFNLDSYVCDHWQIIANIDPETKAYFEQIQSKKLPQI